MSRQRSRYLAVLIESEEPLKGRAFIEAIWKSLLRLFGVYGASKSKVQVIEYDDEKALAVVRCSLSAVRIVRCSIATVTKVNGRPVAFHVIGVSGTLKALRRKFLSQH